MRRATRQTYHLKLVIYPSWTINYEQHETNLSYWKIYSTFIYSVTKIGPFVEYEYEFEQMNRNESE